MSKAGYWNVRVTPSLRLQLDHVASLLKVGHTPDIDVVRFALSFTTAMMPAPLIQWEADIAGIFDAITRDLEALRVYDETYPAAVRLSDLRAKVRDAR